MVRSGGRDEVHGNAMSLGYAREIAEGTSGEANESPNLSRDIQKKEQEIVRLTMIAEKDKRDSMMYTERIKSLKEQIQGLLDDFYQNPKAREELLRKCNLMQLDGGLVFCHLPEHYKFSAATPPSSPPISNRNVCVQPSSLPKADGIENLSPNNFTTIRTPHTSNSPKIERNEIKINSIEHLEQVLRTKDDELRRVHKRAFEESARTAALRCNEEELKQILCSELTKWRQVLEDLRQQVQRKEKEVVRLTILAEQDKKAGMFMSEQIAKLKKSLEVFMNARADNKSQELQQILLRCASDTPPMSSPPTTLSPSHLSPNAIFGEFRGDAARTELRRQIEETLRENACKDNELTRVRVITDSERRRAAALKDKVEELKEALVAEMQKADDELGHKVQEIRRKQKAIHQVAARAERERVRSYFLREEIIKLSKTLCEDGPSGMTAREIKRNEFTPDVAYLQEFSELGDVREFATGGDLSSASHIASPQPEVDPMLFLHSPPSRCIPIGGSENMYVQKLRDIEVLEQQRTRKDEELARIKRIAEAERCRHLLLKDKFQELKDEIFTKKQFLERDGVSRTY